MEFARNVLLDRLDPAEITRARTLSPGEPLYVICRSGSRGRQTCERLVAAGLADVVNVEGGTLGCADAGLAVVRGKKAVSLERQVRIAAGLLILLGAVLAALVHPAFVGLSMFVGAGLVFAGVTDTCGMGMLLARMPWNRGPAAERVGRHEAGGVLDRPRRLPLADTAEHRVPAHLRLRQGPGQAAGEPTPVPR